MRDQKKLREVAKLMEQDGYNDTLPNFLRRIASLLDAVPPETLTGLKAGTWRAVPVEPTKDELEQIEFTYLCWLYPGARDYASSPHGIELATRMRSAMLSAAPAKPED